MASYFVSLLSKVCLTAGLSVIRAASSLSLGLVVTGKKAAVGPADFGPGRYPTSAHNRLLRSHPVDTSAYGIDIEADGAGFENRKEEIFPFSGEQSSPGEGLVGGGKPRLDRLDVHGVVGFFGLEGRRDAEAEFCRLP